MQPETRRTSYNWSRGVTVSTPKIELDRSFQARLREIYLDRDAKCPRCRYHLRGVPGPRCPECGLVITEYLRIADTTAWRLRRARLRSLARRMIGWACLIVLAGGSAIAASLVWL